MKQFFCIFLILTLFISASATEFTALSREEEVPVFLDGLMLDFEVCPIISGGRVIVPARTISEALNADVSWDNDTKTAHINLGSKTVAFTIGRQSMTVNGEEFKIDTPAEIRNSTTFVPLRALSESLGFDVSWDRDTNSVLLTSFPQVEGYIIPVTNYVATGSFEGCVIACKAMVLSNHFGREYTYEEVLELNGGGVYSNWGPEFCENLSWNVIMPSEFEKKLEDENWEKSCFTVREKLDMIYHSLQGSSGIIAQFAKDGKTHGVVITGYTCDNELIVCDPDTKCENPQNTLISDSCLADILGKDTTKELLPYLYSLRVVEK